ncbi:hypothetical protein [Eubacterium sp. F2]|uniref:hypothetical protein n=1 Tax=Eubacterium sp. F2 TaxID=3381348 RepID=UPI0039083ED0
MTRTKSSRALLSVVLAVLMVAAFMPALTYSSFAATAKKATKVTKLNHTGAKVYGKVGNKYVLKYKLSPSKLTSAAKKTVWKSSDSSIVKVYSTKGKHAAVKVKGVGTAKITVYTKANKKAKAVWSFKTKKVEAAAPTIDTSKVQTTYGLSTQYNMVDKSITTADLLKNVTAKDASGKDVTVSIASIKEVSSTGDSINAYINAYNDIPLVKVNNQAKHFEVTYTATDANGKTATKTVVVTVKNLDPEVTANNFSVAIDANHAPLTEDDLINKGITAVNDYESFPADTKAEAKTADAFLKAAKGNTIEVAKITDASGKSLETTDKSVTPAKTTADPSQIVLNKAGTYNITYKVTDYLGASVEKTVTMTVANNQAPTIATTEATVYSSSATPAADVLDQITYNDAEDGQNVKLSKDAKSNVEVTFIDANGIVVQPTDANFYKKVAKAYVINVTDSNGAYAQTKLIDIKVADGLVLTAKDQSVDIDIKAPATTTIDPMQYITATLNGAAYTLDNPATTKGGNTTVYIDGKEVKSTNDLIDAKNAGKYTVKYDVTAKVDGKTLTAIKTITVKVVDKADKDAVDAAVAKINAISTATSGDYAATVNAAKEAYNKLTEVQKNAVPQNTYKILKDAEEEVEKLETLAKPVEQSIDAIGEKTTTKDYASAVDAANKAYDTLNADSKAIVDAAKTKVQGNELTYKDALAKYNETLKNTQAAEKTLSVALNDSKDGATAKIDTSKIGNVTYDWQFLNKDNKWVDFETGNGSAELSKQGYKVRVAVYGAGIAGTLYSNTIEIPDSK